MLVSKCALHFTFLVSVNSTSVPSKILCSVLLVSVNAEQLPSGAFDIHLSIPMRSSRLGQCYMVAVALLSVFLNTIRVIAQLNNFDYVIFLVTVPQWLLKAQKIASVLLCSVHITLHYPDVCLSNLTTCRSPNLHDGIII